MVLADGAFDPLHWGHCRYLAVAASFGEVTVRVAPDADILAKGRLLFQTRSERLQTIAALRAVSAVVDTDQSLAETIRALGPVYLVKGADWRDRLPEDVLVACRENGTQIIFVDEQTKTSTERLRA
jgi:D-beta-D-heptose 7-phosphate kinase/D-beta-D-heptose 1-phosphate adenosyltransferase